jgi:hypothetical protein
MIRSIFITAVLAGWFCSLSLKADSTAYMAGGNGDFGILDLNTGAFTQLGNSGQTLAGLATVNGTLYGASYGGTTGTLYSVNAANGSLNPLGAASLGLALIGSTTGGGIYAIGTNYNLYSINSSTGAATQIGPTGLSTLGSWNGLSDGASILYLTAGADLYTLDTTTGAATEVGPLDGPLVGALVFENGVLYGGENSPTVQIDQINIVTGAATGGPALSGDSTTVWGLAPPAVPEPSTMGLGALGAGVFWFLGRRRNSIKQGRP